MSESSSEVDLYIKELPTEAQQIFARMARTVRATFPTITQGLSYGMPTFFYNGKPLVSVFSRKKFFSLYPFSGKVIHSLADQLTEFEITTGSIHFSAEQPIPDELLREILERRAKEIEEN